MTITGIIAEYNPFHTGHALHLEKARACTNADYLVVVMSGSFTERGLPAVMDKKERAKQALLAGADLVLELPALYASGSAEAFACGAVSVLNSLGCVDYLCFGSESDDLEALITAADLLACAEQNPSYQTALKDALKAGSTYPAARNAALLQIYGKNAVLPSLPNDVLGLEYLRALKRLNSSTKPVCIRREGQGYLEESHPDFAVYASASSLRAMLQQETTIDTLLLWIPASNHKAWQEYFAAHRPVFASDFDAVLFTRLLELSEAKDPTAYAVYADVTEDLSRRIYNNVYQYKTFDQFAALIKTREVTLTRICRALIHILLGLKQEELDSARSKAFPVYLRILGMRADAAPLLSELGRCASQPFITNPARIPEEMPAASRQLLSDEIRSTHLYRAALSRISGSEFRNEYADFFLKV